MINRLGLVDTAAAEQNAKYNCETNGGQIRPNANFIVYSNYEINGPESIAKNELISCYLKIPTQKLNDSFSFRSLNKKQQMQCLQIGELFSLQITNYGMLLRLFRILYTTKKKPHSNRTRLTID